MYISRIYCKDKNKGYLNDYEKYETQVITLHNNDERDIPFILYDVCHNGSELNIDEIVTALMNSSNTTSANTWETEEITKSATYTLKDLDGDTILTDTTTLNEYNIFIVHIEDVDAGYYNLSLEVTYGDETFTKTLPLIST